MENENTYQELKELLKDTISNIQGKKNIRDLKTWLVIIQMVITILVIIFGMFKPFFEMQTENKKFREKTEKRIQTIELVNWQTHPEYRWMMKNPEDNTRGGILSLFQCNVNDIYIKEKNKQ